MALEKIIYVPKVWDYDYPTCPFQGDRGTCEAVKGSEINSCPVMSEEGLYKVPFFCPLKFGGSVRVQFED